MRLPMGVISQLAALAGDAAAMSRARPDLALQELLAGVLLAAPSCVAVSLTLLYDGVAVPVTALSPGAEGRPVRAHLQVRFRPPAATGASLGAPSGRTGRETPGPGWAVLALYGSQPGAFDALRDDLVADLDLGLEEAEVQVDTDLALPDPAAQAATLAARLAELSTIDRALGVLLGQGWPPEAGRQELHRRAAAAGRSSAGAARHLLAGLSPHPPL